MYVGEQEDVSEIINDVDNLGFNTPTHRQCKNTIDVELEPSLGYLLYHLGATIGNKVNVIRKLPEWIKNSHSSIKREFLSGLQGGDGSKVSVNIKTEQQQIRIKELNCRSLTEPSILNSHKKYMNDIINLYAHFDINTTLQEYKTKFENNQWS